MRCPGRMTARRTVFARKPSTGAGPASAASQGPKSSKGSKGSHLAPLGPAGGACPSGNRVHDRPFPYQSPSEPLAASARKTALASLTLFPVPPISHPFNHPSFSQHTIAQHSMIRTIGPS